MQKNDNLGSVRTQTTLCFLGLSLLAFGARYVREPAQKGRHGESFSSAFFHGVVAAHEAIKDEFYMPPTLEDARDPNDDERMALMV